MATHNRKLDELGRFDNCNLAMVVIPTTIFHQRVEVTARRLLEDAQAEFRSDGQQVIKNVGLDFFVLDPIGSSGKDVYLNGNAGWTRIKLTHQPKRAWFPLRRVLFAVHLAVNRVVGIVRHARS